MLWEWHSMHNGTMNNGTMSNDGGLGNGGVPVVVIGGVVAGVAFLLALVYNSRRQSVAENNDSGYHEMTERTTWINPTSLAALEEKARKEAAKEDAKALYLQLKGQLKNKIAALKANLATATSAKNYAIAATLQPQLEHLTQLREDIRTKRDKANSTTASQLELVRQLRELQQAVDDGIERFSNLSTSSASSSFLSFSVAVWEWEDDDCGRYMNA
jgi:hypothetical protein